MIRTHSSDAPMPATPAASNAATGSMKLTPEVKRRVLQGAAEFLRDTADQRPSRPPRSKDEEILSRLA